MTQGIVMGGDYIDEDVAYFLGMLFGNGQLIEDGSLRRIVITLAIRQRQPLNIPGKKLDVAAMNERSLNKVRRRINELLDANVDVDHLNDTKAELTAVFTKKTIAWRDIRYLTSNGASRSSFVLPSEFPSLPKTYQREFVRGFADAACTPNKGDRLPNEGPYRIAFPVLFSNLRS